MAFIDKNEMIDPYFEVRIGPPKAQPDQMVILPTWVHQLIYSFEYSETVNGGQDSASRIKLLFYETLNRPGSVLDLKLDKEGIKFKSSADVKEGKTTQEPSSTANKAVSSNEAKESIDKQKSDGSLLAQKEKEKAFISTYLLQERNTIEVTWGYRSAKNALLQPRRVRAEILQITHRASEGDIPSTEVNAVDVGSGEFAKIYPKEAINFSRGKVKKLTQGKLLDTSSRPDTAPARLDDIVNAICASILENTKANIFLTNEELTLDLQDKNSSRTWGMGTNLHEFLKQLAEKVFAHYYMTTTVENGKVVAVLNIVSRRQHEAFTKFHFMWKSGQTMGGKNNTSDSSSLVFNTLKDYDLQLYPVGGSGGSSTGIDSENKQVVGSSSLYEAQFRTKGTESPKDVSFVKKPQSVKTTGDITKNIKSVGLPVYSPSSSDENHMANSERNAGRMEANLRLAFNSIGIPQLKPEVILLSNVGERYSGPYYLLSVTHTITADAGYVCAAVGESNSIAAGGVDVGGSPVRKNPAPGSFTLDYRQEPGKPKEAILDTLKPVKK